MRWEKDEWRPWFAWHPVVTYNGCHVWWEHIERTHHWLGGFSYRTLEDAAEDRRQKEALHEALRRLHEAIPCKRSAD